MERWEEDSVAQGDLSYRGLARGVSSRSVTIGKGDAMAIKREKIQPQGSSDDRIRESNSYLVTTAERVNKLTVPAKQPSVAL
jgi:hypothetical protein